MNTWKSENRTRTKRIGFLPFCLVGRGRVIFLSFMGRSLASIVAKDRGNNMPSCRGRQQREVGPIKREKSGAQTRPKIRGLLSGLYIRLSSESEAHYAVLGSGAARPHYAVEE